MKIYRCDGCAKDFKAGETYDDISLEHRAGDDILGIIQIGDLCPACLTNLGKAILKLFPDSIVGDDELTDALAKASDDERLEGGDEK